MACPKCGRQYDATGREIGNRFRCRCGEVLTVRQPQEHESAVVRCSACGAPRREGSRHCQFCNADFTVHELDLNTICPQCFARVSDRARFCDHCGEGLTAEPLSTVDSPLVCPVCRGDRRLHSRVISGIGLMECPLCAGLWVEIDAFDQLIERARKTDAFSANELQNGFDRQRPAPAAPQSPHGYLPCPVCGTLMLRHNYQHRSGVIVDYCKRHGVWFAADKLSRLLRWVHCGGVEAADLDIKQETERAAQIRALGQPTVWHREDGSFLHECGLLIAWLFSHYRSL